MLLLFFFFFNDTSTTEIYTYLHTLSLHDALPICHGAARRPADRAAAAADHRAARHHAVDVFRLRAVLRRGAAAADDRFAAGLVSAALPLRRGDRRALGGDRDLDEQIGRAQSELQSLMRISYAVFCLKKKTYTPDNNNNLTSALAESDITRE